MKTELEELLAMRAALQAEKQRVLEAGMIASKENASLLASGALDSEPTLARMSLLRSKELLAPIRAKQLDEEVAKLDAEIGQFATDKAAELWGEIERREQANYARFCDANAQFFREGRAAKFFTTNPHSADPTKVPARVHFFATDAGHEFAQPKAELGRAHLARGLEPVARARAVLKSADMLSAS